MQLKSHSSIVVDFRQTKKLLDNFQARHRFLYLAIIFCRNNISEIAQAKLQYFAYGRKYKTNIYKILFCIIKEITLLYLTYNFAFAFLSVKTIDNYC